MVVLHVASVDDDKSSGVSIVVPEHVKYQNTIVKAALLNCSNSLELIDNYADDFLIFTEQDCPDNILGLPEPFNRPDLVVFHGVYFPYFCKIAKHLRRIEIPYIIVPHGSLTALAQQKKHLKKLIGNALLFNKFIKDSRAIQYLTEQEQQMSSFSGIESFICGNGMEVSNRNSPRFDTVRSDKFEITYIGRLDPFHKGLDVLIQACNSISDIMRTHNIRLSIFGPDYQNGKEQVIRLINKYAIEDVVVLKGPIYETDKIFQLLKTDVFVLTSRFEGQPLAAMEALSMGIPVIVTPGTNIAEDVARYECGWSADFTPESISECIVTAYRSRAEMKNLSTRARLYSRDHFAWGRIARMAIEHYESIIKNSTIEREIHL